MKKTVLIATLLFLSLSVVRGQQIYLNTGKIISHYNFENSEGNVLPNLLSSSHTSMDFGYQTTFFTKSLLLNIGASYHNYGAIGSSDLVNNYFEWNTNYVGVLLGFDLKLFRVGALNFFIKTSVSSEFMVQGTQTLNNRVINIVGQEDFDAPMFFYRGGISMEWEITEKFSASGIYTYGNGISFKKNPEKLNIISHNISFGLIIKIQNQVKQKNVDPLKEDTK